MNWFNISIPLIVIGFLLYNVSQKSIPKEANALVAIATAYLVAFISCVTVLFFGGEFKKGISFFSGQKLWPIIFPTFPSEMFSGCRLRAT